jgi:hypothetical protein
MFRVLPSLLLELLQLQLLYQVLPWQLCAQLLAHRRRLYGPRDMQQQLGSVYEPLQSQLGLELQYLQRQLFQCLQANLLQLKMSRSSLI